MVFDSLTSPPHPIVVGVAPDSDARGALALAGRFSRATGAPLLLVTAWTDDPPGRTTERRERGLAASAQAALDAARTRLGPDVAVRCRAVRGTPASRVLQSLAADVVAGLVVIGSTHRHGLGRVIPGSTGARFLHGAPCALAIAPAGYDGSPELSTVGVAYADTPEGRDALAAGLAVAALVDARVELLAVLPTGAPVPATAVPGWETSAPADDARRTHAGAALARAAASVPPELLAGYRLLQGDPVRRLAEASRGVDLLVCGSRGYDRWRSALAHGVSRGLVDAAHCPLLVVPRTAVAADDMTHDTIDHGTHL